jgi:hypothetical protein
MKLYVITYVDDDKGPDIQAEWHGLKAQWQAAQGQLRRIGMRNIQAAAIDVPIDKPGLLRFLNAAAVPTQPMLSGAMP